MFLHSRSPSPELPTRMEQDALGLSGRLTSPAQSMLLAQLLGTILFKKGLQQCRKPLSLESQDCTIMSKMEFYISQYSWETAMGAGRREGTVVHSKFSCPFCHLNLDSLETDFFVVVVDVLGVWMLLMVTAHHLPLPRHEGQVQSPDSDLLPCQRGGSALSAQHTSSGQLQTHLPRVTSPG